ncbi:MAG: hypothetical protein C0596_02475 [Marinilabiliales bacterium]|nr:MAG: hypothetical protein C0596_02475 [Marinilabiliales bacterium]
MKTITILLLSLIFSLYSYSQGIEHGVPALKNYSPKDYGQESQNFSLLQDQNSIMYFGNSNGIMEFDNTNWRIAKVN